MRLKEKIEKYINEDEPERKIYFAHPQKYYNKKEELKAYRMIIKKGPDHIVINPHGKRYDRAVKKVGFQTFYNAVRLSEFTVAMPMENGVFSGGVYKEMLKTKKMNKDVGMVDPGKGVIKKINVNTADHISKDDPYYKKFAWDED